MATTTGNALKALVEAAGLGLQARRDRPGEDELDLPYVTIDEEIALVPDGRDGTLDRNVSHVGNETCQVNLWQRYVDESGAIVEDSALLRGLQRAVNGVPITTTPTKGWMVKLISSRRRLERGRNIVHHALTVKVVRDL